MADIKTRETVKGTIKTLDKAAIAGQKMKQAYIATKDKAEHIPIWEKKCLTVEEAAAYSGIGERRLKALLMDKDCSFRIARSDRLLIIREKLEEFIDSSTEL